MKRYLVACALALGLTFSSTEALGENVLSTSPEVSQGESDGVLFRAPLLGEERPKIDLQGRMDQARRSEPMYEMLRVLSEAGYVYYGGLEDSFNDANPGYAVFGPKRQKEGIYTYLMFNGNNGLSVEEAKIKFSHKF